MKKIPRYTLEQKLQACEDYLSGRKSTLQIAKELGMGSYGYSYVNFWIRQFRKSGSAGLERKPRNRSYSRQFKMKVVKEYNSGVTSKLELAIKYKIPSTNTVRTWIRKYNNHIELEDYAPKPEVYMAKRKKTTFEERIEIAKWCLDHGRSYKEAAARFACSYQQVRNWVIKYEKGGEEALKDKRGKRKVDEQLTDLEKAQRTIKKMERELEAMRKENILLKKVMDAKRW